MKSLTQTIEESINEEYQPSYEMQYMGTQGEISVDVGVNRMYDSDVLVLKDLYYIALRKLKPSNVQIWQNGKTTGLQLKLNNLTYHVMVSFPGTNWQSSSGEDYGTTKVGKISTRSGMSNTISVDFKSVEDLQKNGKKLFKAFAEKLKELSSNK